jgi:signal peptidase I
MELKLFIAGCILFVATMIMQLFKKCFRTLKAQKVFKQVYSWLDTAWSALIMASFIMFFFIQAFQIPTGSMRNTLLEGDHLFVNKFIYGFKIPFASSGKRYFSIRDVKSGDIVVFQCPPEALSTLEREQGVKKDYIKRCVAVGGDKVEIRNKKLFVNDTEVYESYVTFGDHNILRAFDLFSNNEDYQKSWQNGKLATVPAVFVRDNFGPVVVPEGHYMMLGDNRDFSFDSRFWGPLPDKNVKGKPLFLYWPIKRWRLI